MIEQDVTLTNQTAAATPANSAKDFSRVRQLLDATIDDVVRHAELSADQEKAVRHAAMRSTEIGLLWPLATPEQQTAMSSEIKALNATLATIGETKAIELVQLIESRLNSALSRGLDMLADRLIGPN